VVSMLACGAIDVSSILALDICFLCAYLGLRAYPQYVLLTCFCSIRGQIKTTLTPTTNQNTCADNQISNFYGCASGLNRVGEYYLQ
jgi:hypothetical protein